MGYRSRLASAMPPARTQEGWHAPPRRSRKYDPRADGHLGPQDAERGSALHQRRRSQAARRERYGEAARAERERLSGKPECPNWQTERQVIERKGVAGEI